MTRRPAPALLLALASVLVAACGGSGDSDDDGDAADPADVRDGVTPVDETTTTTAVPAAFTAETTGETEVPAGYRQGLARAGDGWVFSTSNGLYRTDSSFTETQKAEGVIPVELAAEGYDHVGDVDITDGVLWAPIEKPDKESGLQVIARYDPATLTAVGHHEVVQHHASFVAADQDGVVYSVDEFDGDNAILRYRWDGETLAPIEPLGMDRTIERIQGGDVADGALFLSTDDAGNGVYRVDLATGHVSELGPAGDPAGEGEGIDATDLPSGLLHVLVADPQVVPMWLVDVSVTPVAPEAPGG